MFRHTACIKLLFLVASSTDQSLAITVSEKSMTHQL